MKRKHTQKKKRKTGRYSNATEKEDPLINEPNASSVIPDTNASH